MPALPKLTPHQAEVFRRVAHLQATLGFPVREQNVGSHGALWRLIRKGYLEAHETVGPRGGIHYSYTLTTAAHEKLQEQKRQDFWDYFNVADEIYEGLCPASYARPQDPRPLDQTQSWEARGSSDQWMTLADLDPRAVEAAKRAADAIPALSWPPYLPHAEEWSLAHPELSQKAQAS